MKKFFNLIALTLLIFSLCVVPSDAKTHTFMIPKEKAYNGNIQSDIPPVLTIDSGDTVIFNTIMLFEGKLAADMTIEQVVALRKDLQARKAGVYAFTGPFYINGAEPGDVLEIKIKRIVPGDYGVTYIYPEEMGLGGLPEGSKAGFFKTLWYSPDKKTTEFKPGITLQLRPFLGTMAVAPKPGEVHPPGVPNYFAGNMDNKELVVGTTLYVPVNVPGALFMAADAHGLQGDGEVCITACETYFDEVELEFVVRKDIKLELPMAESPTHWIVMGFHKDLDEAMKIAVRQAIEFLTKNKGLTSDEAYALCSLAVDFRVTQVVDGNKGIHGMIPKDIFK